MDNWILINRNGSLEQRPFLMQGGKESVTEHLSKSELDADDGTICMFEPMLALFEHTRKTIGRPIAINSGYRTPAHQDRLKQQGYKAAGDSPHLRGAALDCALPAGINAEQLAMYFRQSAHALGLPRPRLGWKQYGGAFLHVDLVFMMYDKYMPLASHLPNGVRIGGPNPHPANWREGVTW